MAKTLYHSAFRRIGPVRVTVKSDVLQSKFSKPNAPKPDYVVLEIASEEWNYSLENPTCGKCFEGQKGNTFTVIADGGGKGKEDTATVTYVGEAAGDDGDVAPTAPTAPARSVPRAAAPKGITPHNTSVPTGHPTHVAPAARPAAANVAPAQTRAQFAGHPGARVGACMNKSVDYLIAEGMNSSDPAFSQTLYNLVSDMVRICAAIEDGHLAPKQSERTKE